MVDEIRIYYKKRNKDYHVYCKAMMLFKFEPIVICQPISFFCFAIFLILSIVCDFYRQITIIMVSFAVCFVYLTIIEIILFFVIKKRYLSAFNNKEEIAFELIRNDERLSVTCIDNKTTIEFCFKEISRIKFFRKIIMIDTNNKNIKGVIALPNLSSIKSVLKNKC